ncbi:MAG: Malate-2H(+)/Na(+)-lactate antiporter [Syntrophomonadaceae bacterium]|nr:Malate-2H(+)/Na(+)-lactate antiporter [Bacillota bacterium]MBT9148118.1 Malate-2H(+)/Na(+)-lactate antiporter [Bacillota bacterium]
MTPYMYFVHSIPYMFYSLMLLGLVFIVVIWKRDYGPMLAAEHRARTTGKLIRDGGRPLGGGVELDVVERVKYRASNMWVPLVILIGMTVFAMWWTGGGPDPGVSFGDAIAAADAATALLWGVMTAVIVTFGMNLGQRLGGLTQNMDAFVRGLSIMLFAGTILILAWSIKTACDAVGTAPFVVGALEGIIAPVWLPIGIFTIAAIISFATGTSWGTMAIVTPLAIPLAHAIGADMVISISAVLTGAIFGDHCSPISDTTVMASTFTGSDHIDHVRTQLPYAVTAAIVAAILYILAGVGVPVIVVLAIGVIALVGVVYILSRYWSKRTGIPQPIPE